MKKNVYAQVFSRLCNNSVLLVISIVMLILSAVLAGYVPVTIGQITDACGGIIDEKKLFGLIISLLIFVVSKEIFSNIQSLSTARVMLLHGRKLREDCYKAILKKNYSESKSINVGNMIQVIFEDIDRINDYGMNALTDFISNAILAGIAFYNIAKVYLNLAIIATVVYLIYLLPTVYFGKKQKVYSDRLYYSSVNIKSTFLEKLETIRLVKTFGKEKKERSELESLVEPWVNALVKNEVMRQIFKSFPRVLDALAPALIFIIGGISLFQNKISIGSFVMILTFLPCINAPIRSLSGTIFTFKDIETRLRAVYALAEGDDSCYEKCLAKVDDVQGNFMALNIKVNNERGTVLNVKKLEVKSGEKIAFVGETGSGKSTMLRILAGVQTPDEGQVYLDNIDINEIDPAFYRKDFGAVLQNPYIFNESLNYNLMLSNKECDEKKRDNYMRLLGLSKEFEEEGKSVFFKLGEGGGKLSGGQRQRVAIVRSLLQKPKVLFFDEGTSALDAATEEKVLQLIRTELNNSTILFVAHRLETIMNVDRIFVFKNGEIVETGNHRELLQKRGEYYKLWNIRKETAC